MKKFLWALKMLGMVILSTIVVIFESIAFAGPFVFWLIAFFIVSLFRGGVADSGSITPAIIVTLCFYVFLGAVAVVEHELDERQKATNAPPST